MMVCTCEILVGGQLGQVKSVVIKISLQGGGGLILVYIHTRNTD